MGLGNATTVTVQPMRSSSRRQTSWRAAVLLWTALQVAGCATYAPKPLPMPMVGKWERFECVLQSSAPYVNPLQEVLLEVTFTGPSGEVSKVDGFWDGANTWKARFSPTDAGVWRFETHCSDTSNTGLHRRSGRFLCTAPKTHHRFSEHGPVRVHRSGRYFEHQDGTPFFWMGDTAWSGPMRSTDDEWQLYLRERSRQKFTAVQWVATPYRASPEGDAEQQPAFSGTQRIAVNPRFFQRLDGRLESMNRAGLLGVPVLIWDNGGMANPKSSPGTALPEDQIILLARHMVARWGANHVVWLLNGDGDYRGARAERWKRIGRAVFGNISHAPVSLHPGGRQWVWDSFAAESWLDVCGYQSGHNETDDNLRWIHSGPPAKAWTRPPYRPFISLEAPYEHHFGSDRLPMGDFVVRRAHYWSLLNAPTCGVVYGGHGVWGWDDGSGPPFDHPNTGTPLPWRNALVMPGAEQMSILSAFFSSIDFHRLRPAPALLAVQPGEISPRRFVSCSQSSDRQLTVIYVPEDRSVLVRSRSWPDPALALWVNPRTGSRTAAHGQDRGEAIAFETPGEGDWLLWVAGK